MSESTQDKRHAPTERRLRQAAEKGDIRRSADLPKAAAIVLAVTIALNAAALAGAQIQALLATCLAEAGTTTPEHAILWSNTAISELAPLLALIAILSTIAALLSGGWVFALEKLLPDLSKFLPTQGLGQVFSTPGYTETLKSVLKFVVIGGTAAILIAARMQDFAALAGAGTAGGGALVSLCLDILTGICVAIIAVAGLHVILPARYRVQPVWVIPVVLLALPAGAAEPPGHDADRQRPEEREDPEEGSIKEEQRSAHERDRD